MSDAKPIVVDVKTSDDIRSSVAMFDLNASLTDEEIEMMGQVGSGAPRIENIQSFKPAQDIEEDKFEENTTPVSSELDYNSQYAYYLKCQSVVTLVSFTEGWEAFRELVLKKFVRIQRQENKDYRGTDPYEGSALRLREQAAEDFLTFINSVLEEIKAVPKPVLKQQ